MKNFILTCLCNAVLLVALCLPSEARMIVGLTPVAPLSAIDQTALNQLSKQLATSATTDVKIRRFDNDAAITNWLLRFQEIDAAIVAPWFIKQQPAGALKHLADLHAKDSTASPLALVIRSNLGNEQATNIKEAFLKLGASDDGRKALGNLGLAGVTPPGEALIRRVAKPEPPPAQPVKEKTPLPATKIKPSVAPKPHAEAISAPQKAVEKPQTVVKVKEQRPKGNVAEPESASETTIKTSSKPKPAAEVPQKQIVQEPAKVEPKPAEQPKPTEQPEVKPQPSKQEPQAELAQPKAASDKRLALFAALILLFVILLKAGLFVMRWQKKKKSAFKPEAAPTMETTFGSEEVATPVATPEDTPASEDLIIEEGRLGPGKVPALLKRCADLPKPVVLQITKGSCEKLVYFAGGQVSGALTQNAATSESGVRWNKLGNLLVREELITREERDQGMALLINEPKLRFGEALLKLGLIDLTALRHALTRQAKVTIYSLILFPEGRYQILSDDGSLPPEESVSLEITNLIREASHHQSEWAAIRQALPNLNTALDFSLDGRSKLEKVSISAQQEATLSLIDGKSTINDLCIESSMMDYEVYRFLYLMVKAGVLASRTA